MDKLKLNKLSMISSHRSWWEVWLVSKTTLMLRPVAKFIDENEAKEYEKQKLAKIGLCPKCKKIFDKKRSNAVYCSKVCGTIVRVRRSRAKKKNENGVEL